MTVTLLFGASAHAEIYRWVDDNGITHYGDNAPQARQSQTLDFGQLRRPAATKNNASRETRINFPGQPRSVTPRSKPIPQRKIIRRSTPARQRQVLHRPASPAQQRKVTSRPAAPAQKNRVTNRSASTKPTKKLRAKTLPVAESQPQEFREFQLIEETEQSQVALLETKPNLDAEEYDFVNATKNIKQKLCSEKRILLSALQEKGFRAYSDEEGNYRLVWGGDGIYQGKRRFLTDKEVVKKTKKAMFEVEQYCVIPNDKALQETARANWIRSEYCTVSKAVLEDLEHPFMRATEVRINEQAQEVERFCAPLAPGRYRNDNRYYPIALRPDVVLPRHLTLKEEEVPEVRVRNSEETLDQLLALIQ